jgi:hypothetical protein
MKASRLSGTIGQKECRMSKFKCRKKSESQMPNDTRSAFVIPISSFLRHFDFVIRHWSASVFIFVLCLIGPPALAAPSSDPLAKPAPTWQPMPADQVKAQVFAWLETQKPSDMLRAKLIAVWEDLAPGASEDDLLLRVVQTFALLDSRAAQLMALCSRPRDQQIPPAEAWLRDAGNSPLLANNLRLFYARWLVHESLFDEAMEQLSGLLPGDVVAPASLLFHQSVVHHALLNKELGLKAIEELLQGADASPQRYVALARLMQEDLKGLQDDTLDHISRRMDDIRRRLDLGRAGPKVRKQEDGVVKSLDKLIKKIEDQQKDQDGSSGNNLRPSNPANESRIMRGKGPGEVTKKNVGAESGWGDLPPKEREEAMQQIGREFPSHYRDVIEQYFRRLAAEEGEEDPTDKK